MTKRRKISEIYNEMDEISKRKPTEIELDELAEVLNEIEDDHEELPIEKIASSHINEGSSYGDESNRIQ